MSANIDKQYVIVDTDMGVDDWMALTYLLSNRNTANTIQAITVSGTGLAHGENGIENLYRLLYTFNYATTTIAYGQPNPIEGTHQFPENAPWGRAATDAVADDIAAHLRPVPLMPNFRSNAAKLLVEELSEKPDSSVDLIALGPLTNIAAALMIDSSIASKIKTLTIMGGAIDVPGNVGPSYVAEWNIYIDPTAAQKVFQMLPPDVVQLVPLDITNQVPVTSSFLQSISPIDQQNPCSPPQIVTALLNLPWILPEIENPPPAYDFWDSLAMAFGLAVPSAAISQTNKLVVNTETGQITKSTRGEGNAIRWYSGFNGNYNFAATYLAQVSGTH